MRIFNSQCKTQGATIGILKAVNLTFSMLEATVVINTYNLFLMQANYNTEKLIRDRQWIYEVKAWLHVGYPMTSPSAVQVAAHFGGYYDI